MSSADSASYDGYDSMEEPPNRSKFQPKVKRGYRGDLDVEVQNYLGKVWKAVWDHDFSMPFHQPVNVSQPNVDTTSYLKIIHNPMDLESIRLRLKNRYYETTEECIKDFNTIFTNFYVYNTIKEQHQDIIEKAMQLKEFFLVKLKEMEVELLKPGSPPINNNYVVHKKSKSRQTYWTVKLEDVPEDEMKLILPLLSNQDLKNLKLTSKRCALMVTQNDRRMNHWYILVIRQDCPMPIFDVYANLSLATCSQYFKHVNIILDIDSPYKYEEPELSNGILKLCTDNVVNLTIELEEEDEDYFLNHVCLPKLKTLHITGLATGILNNKSIADTVTNVTIRWSHGENDIQFSYSKLQHLVANGVNEHFTKVISPQLSTLIMVNAKSVEYGKVPMLPNLKTLVVDATSVNLLYKCSDNVEDLTFTTCYPEKQLRVPGNLICPKLKQLVFGQNCPPIWKFIKDQTSTVETLVVPGMLNRNDHYPCDTEEFNFKKHSRINDYDLDKLNAMIRNSPSLHTLVLPSNLKKKVRDASGKVKIFFSIRDAAKVLSLNNRYVFENIDFIF